jgi:hypothetical protein
MVTPRLAIPPLAVRHRLSMHIGKRSQLINIESEVFKFFIHDDEQNLIISTS